MEWGEYHCSLMRWVIVAGHGPVCMCVHVCTYIGFYPCVYVGVCVCVCHSPYVCCVWLYIRTYVYVHMYE